MRVTSTARARRSVQFIELPGRQLHRDHRRQSARRPCEAPGGFAIKVFVGGRDDAFFNDLPGFFRSINYAPQFYHVPHGDAGAARAEDPEDPARARGQHLFNFDPAIPLHGQGVKHDLPPGPLTWNGDQFHKDADGNFRFVYSGKDAQAGKNVNAIILEFPLAFLTESPDDRPDRQRLGRELGAQGGQQGRDDPRPPAAGSSSPSRCFDAIRLDDELKRYKLVDTDGQPFADAGAQRARGQPPARRQQLLAGARTSSSGWRTSAGASARRSRRSGCRRRSTTTIRRSRCTGRTRYGDAGGLPARARR